MNTDLEHLSVPTLEYIESRLTGWTRANARLDETMRSVIKRFQYDTDTVLDCVQDELALRGA